jgi:hypothetical protein
MWLFWMSFIFTYTTLTMLGLIWAWKMDRRRDRRLAEDRRQGRIQLTARQKLEVLRILRRIQREDRRTLRRLRGCCRPKQPKTDWKKEGF